MYYCYKKHFPAKKNLKKFGQFNNLPYLCIAIRK